MPPRSRRSRSTTLKYRSPLILLGIKGAGEAGVIPSAAVFASAIEDAEGIRHLGHADLA